ncbi:bifunctional (p)ppGpp synthetase/guanosine-3',5'-bis(diphosphate) 3'-pyrophosphohydrolase [Anaeromyxobacter sp. PSR-1]|uniref:RelA/SpoT family protein n=1 Tax=unclassified Anaeromyxobacter TaxID=2620896 RepID=UPI0005E4425C|nr:bifunctional (p)ppGpp synthetase/guanosine-3',5'-bis(diphosphate) 3'-pyrophosphohydrolase [Anaeromyxobacter sp. PSR-1]GAO03955.1 GTP pyrophosphokinase [Anaeromyxobacter sp. PSR-1]
MMGRPTSLPHSDATRYAGPSTLLRLNDILDRVSGYHPDPDLDLIKKAYVYSAKVHQGQIRKSGEPYLVHPLEVAGILAELKLDESSVVTGLLHDTIEDTLATKKEISELFGLEIAELVDGVTKLSQFTAANTQEEKQAENFRKMVVAMAKDIRVLLVKLADRTHNMRTLDAMKPESQERIARETLDIYAPLANRLGIQWIKTELEELSFKYLRPADYSELNEKVSVRAREKERFVAEVVEIIRRRLAEAGMKADVSGRVKHVYSIYRKMRQLDVDFEQIQDVVGFRVIVDTVAECYESLGFVHALWKPVPGRFKDYIAIPKPNLYQSLHTTVVGPAGERIEVQIRTREMHRIAEEGVAAHWAYKEKGRDGKGAELSRKDAESFGWLRQLVEFQRDLADPREFLETVKVDLFSDEVFVFTPKGAVKSLPRGATPVDFAYTIHSEIGEHCVGAKVNGKLVPLRYKLKNGDTIEILTSPNAHPSKDWLTFVKTSRAQARIRQFIRQAEHRRSVEIGRDIAERELRRFGVTLNKLQKGGELEKAAQALGYRQADDVLAAVGYGKVSPGQLLQQVLPPDRLAEPPPPAEAPPTSRITELFRKMARRPTEGVRINGIDDVLVRYGKCCNPVPGDAIVGFITRGRGVTVHTASCDKVLGIDPERRVDVAWDVRGDFKRPVSLRVITTDRPGILAKISQTFSEAGVNISQASCRTTPGERAVNDFEVTIGDLKQLNSVIRSIERIEGVQSVQRV